jgi:hypothetical protein
MMMKTKTLLVTTLAAIGLILTFTAAGLHLSTHSALAAEGFSLESLECGSGNDYMIMTVIMPSSFTGEQLEIESKRVCDSLNQYTKEDAQGPKAVCDTDTNCDYWDWYSNYGVARIYVSHDDDKGMRWLSVTCLGDTPEDDPWIIDDPSEMEVICKNDPKPTYTDKDVKGYRWDVTMDVVGEQFEHAKNYTLVRTPNLDVIFPKGALAESVVAIVTINFKLTHSHKMPLVEEESIMQVSGISVQTKDGVVQADTWVWTNKDKEYSSDPH